MTKCPNGHLMVWKDGDYVCALCKYFVKKCTCKNTEKDKDDGLCIYCGGVL